MRRLVKFETYEFYTKKVFKWFEGTRKADIERAAKNYAKQKGLLSFDLLGRADGRVYSLPSSNLTGNVKVLEEQEAMKFIIALSYYNGKYDTENRFIGGLKREEYKYINNMKRSV